MQLPTEATTSTPAALSAVFSLPWPWLFLIVLVALALLAYLSRDADRREWSRAALPTLLEGVAGLVRACADLVRARADLVRARADLVRARAELLRFWQK